MTTGIEISPKNLNDRQGIVRFLETRRSASHKAMGTPGPSEEQVEQILNIAIRVPDHGKLAPWRFILFEGEGSDAAGNFLADRWQTLNPGHGSETIEQQRITFSKVPLVIAVVSTAKEHVKIPIWEQQLSAGAVCQNMLTAATAMGIGCNWITGWAAFDRPFLEFIGVDEAEQIAGFMYFGTPTLPLEDRKRPALVDLVTRFEGHNNHDH